MLKQFHSGHPGINRKNSIARSHSYWPEIDDDIENMVNKCQKCQNQQKHPALQDSVPRLRKPERDFILISLVISEA